MDLDKLQELIEAGYITKRKHPTADLYIYNYTKRCVYEGIWNDITLECRGLILDGQGDVVARPFTKFFNLGETSESKLENLPQVPFEVTEKMDGSLGILYRVNGEYAIATRGSFESEQAIWATNFLHKNWERINLKPDVTVLFEIIYPENRIVLNYGDKEDLVVLGARRFDGTEFSRDDLETFCFWNDFSLVEQHKISSFDDLLELQKTRTGGEGWVIRFKDGFRVKVKCEEYMQLHRLVFGLTPARIKEAMLGDFIDFVTNLPEEFKAEVYTISHQIREDVMREVNRIEQIFTDTVNLVGYDRKTFAIHVVKNYPQDKGYLFMLLDGKNIYTDILKKLEV